MPSVKREPLIVEPPLALLAGGVHSISPSSAFGCRLTAERTRIPTALR